MRALPGLVAGLTLLATAGCSQPGSGDLPTDAMSATIVVVVGPVDSQVTAVLSTGDLASVELQGADELRAASGAISTTLGHDRLMDSDSYAGGLDRVTDPGTEVMVSLRRDAHSATGSSVTLPEPVFVVQPKPDDQVPRSRELVIGTNAGTGSVRVEWAGSCINDNSLDLAEGAPVAVPPGAVVARDGAECAVTYTVSRISTGALDPAWGGGSITAQRSVSVAVRSVP